MKSLWNSLGSGKATSLRSTTNSRINQDFQNFNFDNFDNFQSTTDFGFDSFFFEFSGDEFSSFFGFTNEDVYYKATVSIEQLYSGDNVKVDYRRRGICHTCSGRGFRQVDICPSCSGRGYHTRTEQRAQFFTNTTRSLLSMSRSGFRFIRSMSCLFCYGRSRDWWFC